MKVTIIAVGKLKEQYLTDACREYIKRLTGFCRTEIIEIGEERLPENPSPAEIAAALAAEGERLAARIPKGAYVTALCVEGAAEASELFAAGIKKAALSGFSEFAFIIGGSWGLSDNIKAAAHKRLSLSKMTFPHQLTRVILLEQLYRAFSINNHGKYHK